MIRVIGTRTNNGVYDQRFWMVTVDTGAEIQGTSLINWKNP